MPDPRERPIDYSRPRPGLDRYERNGWIGLGITLGVCLIAYVLFHR